MGLLWISPVSAISHERPIRFFTSSENNCGFSIKLFILSLFSCLLLSNRYELFRLRFSSCNRRYEMLVWAWVVASFTTKNMVLACIFWPNFSPADLLNNGTFKNRTLPPGFLTSWRNRSVCFVTVGWFSENLWLKGRIYSNFRLCIILFGWVLNRDIFIIFIAKDIWILVRSALNLCLKRFRGI